MNLLILLAGLLPWATSPIEVFTRVFLAISLLSVEMQIVTVSGIGTIYTLPIVNAVIAVVLIGWQVRTTGPVSPGKWLPHSLPIPWAVVAALAFVVVLLNVSLPLQAADPYHLDRVTLIERSGTLEYDPRVEPKINILGWVYELVLADLHEVPGVGAGLLKLHGVLGLLLYAVTLAVVCTMLPSGQRRWPAAALLLVPAVFHQLVLVKNDLFIAAPALVVLAWLVTGASTASWKGAVWAGWLIGFVVGYKLTNLPLAFVAIAAIGVAGRNRVWHLMSGLVLGGIAGVASSGLLLTLWENARWYGDAFATGPVTEIGNRTTSVAEAAVSVARFAISLVDLGVLTPTFWPGRGGWGGTFGLPFIWALAVLVLSWRRAREARWALMIAAFHFVAFSAVFPDADLAHRLALAPALLMIAVAVHLVGRSGEFATPARLALLPVLVLSGAQILRSAVLYVARG